LKLSNLLRTCLVPTTFLLIAGCLWAAEGPRLVFTKSFPGSTPAYVEISVEKTGDSLYKEDPKDENPLQFKLSEADTSAVFALSDKVSRSPGPLESGLKIAFMGKKTFRWEGGAAVKEATFNYSEDVEAKALLDWFERISETERALIDLERSVRFDKLGVQDSILQIEVTRNQKRLVAAEQFLPLLDKVVKNEKYLHIARSRAAALAESIRGVK
jgi:hypothetical protein